MFFLLVCLSIKQITQANIDQKQKIDILKKGEDKLFVRPYNPKNRTEM